MTAYDALFTRIIEEAGIDTILVGDSLGVVVQGQKDTLAVTMDEMLYHTKLVAKAAQRALIIGDMPFLLLSGVCRGGRICAMRATFSSGGGGRGQAGRWDCRT